MKKILILFCFSLLFAACKKENETPISTSPFAGSWYGTFTGNDSGIWSGNISSSGILSGSIYSNSIGLITGIGTVTNNGNFSATFGTTSSGATFSGTLIGNSGLGSWQNGTDQGI